MYSNVTHIHTCPMNIAIFPVVCVLQHPQPNPSACLVTGLPPHHIDHLLPPQILGLDYLLDEHLHPWLLEVNSAPSIMAQHSQAATCSMIRKQKKGMLADAVAMVLPRMQMGGVDADGKQSKSSSASASSTHPSPSSTHSSQSGSGIGSAATNVGAGSGPKWRQLVVAELQQRGGWQPLMPAFQALQARVSRIQAAASRVVEAAEVPTPGGSSSSQSRSGRDGNSSRSSSSSSSRIDLTHLRRLPWTAEDLELSRLLQSDPEFKHMLPL
jgi:hypothetical protein